MMTPNVERLPAGVRPSSAPAPHNRSGRQPGQRDSGSDRAERIRELAVRLRLQDTLRKDKAVNKIWQQIVKKVSSSNPGRDVSALLGTESTDLAGCDKIPSNRTEMRKDF